MKKSDIEFIQRSRIIESGQTIKQQIDTIVRSINHKYPELASNIEIPQNLFYQNLSENRSFKNISIRGFFGNILNQNLLA